MHKGMDNQKLDKIEKLLREQGRIEFTPDFEQRVMASVRTLPAPAMIKPRRGWRETLGTLKALSSGELTGAGLIVLGIAALLLPQTYELLLTLEWQLTDLHVSLSIGETVLSASMLSVITTAVGGLFVTGVGAYAARNHLIGA